MGADRNEYITEVSTIEVDADASREKAFNKKLLANLGKKILNGQQVEEFCRETGLSRSFVSKLINEKLDAKPRRRSLLRMIGENCSSRNGVTAKELLLAAGYYYSEPHDKNEVPVNKTDCGSLPLADVISVHYAPSPTCGLSHFLDGMINHGYGRLFNIRYQPGMYRIILESTQQEFIVVPAFCQDSSGITAVKVSALERVVMALNFANDFSRTFYFVITNQKTIFEDLRNFRVLEKMLLSVLLVDDENTGFADQFLLTQDRSYSSKKEMIDKGFPFALT